MVMANEQELVQKSRVRRTSSRMLGFEKKDTVGSLDVNKRWCA